MKYVLLILFFISLAGIAVGFYIKTTHEATGNLFVGGSLMLGFFIVMPLFIYHRWKNKDVGSYMLTKENIEKMREFNEKPKK